MIQRDKRLRSCDCGGETFILPLLHGVEIFCQVCGTKVKRMDFNDAITVWNGDWSPLDFSKMDTTEVDYDSIDYVIGDE